MTTISSSCCSMEHVQDSRAVDSKKSHKGSSSIKLEDKSDTFEKSQGSAVNKVAFAGITTSMAFPGIKKMATALPGKIEGGVMEVVKDFDVKNFKMPKNFNPAVKYAALATGTLTAFCFAMKDSDNDGQLDIVEAVKKFFSPA